MDNINALYHSANSEIDDLIYLVVNPAIGIKNCDIAIIFKNLGNNIHNTMVKFDKLFNIESIFAHKQIGCILFSQKNFAKAINDIRLGLDVIILIYVKTPEFSQLVEVMDNYVQLGKLKMSVKKSSFEFITTKYVYNYIGHDPQFAHKQKWHHATIFIDLCQHANIDDYWSRFNSAKIISIFYFHETFRICILSDGKVKTDATCTRHNRCSFKELVAKMIGLDIAPIDYNSKKIPSFLTSSMTKKDDLPIQRIMNLKETKKYVNQNSNDICNFVIVHIASINDQKLDNFLVMFDSTLVDKIFLMDNFMIAFLQDPDVFENMQKVLSGNKFFQLCSELDYMYPGLFDEKYDEISMTLQQIRTEMMMTREKMMKINAEKTVARNIEQTKLLVIQKNIDKILRSFDLNQSFVCDVYKTLKFLDVDMRIIEKLCANKPDITVILEEIVHWIVKCLLKNLICSKEMIMFHPYIYYLCVLAYIFDNSQHTIAMRIADLECRKKILRKLNLERDVIFKKNVLNVTPTKKDKHTIKKLVLNQYIGYPDEVVIEISEYPTTCYDVNANDDKHDLPRLLTFNKVRQNLNQYLDGSDMACFKELLMRNFWLILCSKSYECGSFQILPKEIIYSIVHYMICVVRISK